MTFNYANLRCRHQRAIAVKRNAGKINLPGVDIEWCGPICVGRIGPVGWERVNAAAVICFRAFHITKAGRRFGFSRGSAGLYV